MYNSIKTNGCSAVTPITYFNENKTQPICTSNKPNLNCFLNLNSHRLTLKSIASNDIITFIIGNCEYKKGDSIRNILGKVFQVVDVEHIGKHILYNINDTFISEDNIEIDTTIKTDNTNRWNSINNKTYTMKRLKGKV